MMMKKTDSTRREEENKLTSAIFFLPPFSWRHLVEMVMIEFFLCKQFFESIFTRKTRPK